MQQASFISTRARAFMLVAAFCAFGHAKADIVTQYTGGNDFATLLFAGQSFTTSPSGAFDHITFNFFSDTAGGTTPTAAGTLYLLTQAYSGTPGALSSSTAGFFATSLGIVGGAYDFDDSIVLLANTQYFAYSNTQVMVSGSNTNAYAGGTAFVNSGGNYTLVDGDANFRVSGTQVVAVPTPGSFALSALALACLLGSQVSRHRRTGLG